MSTSNTLTMDFTLRLRDGRTMGVASVGKSDGFSIFHCHGSGSSRLEVNLLAAAATAQGVRLIGLDRPGIGRSDAKAGYRLLDWPDKELEARKPSRPLWDVRPCSQPHYLLIACSLPISIPVVWPPVAHPPSLTSDHGYHAGGQFHSPA